MEGVLLALDDDGVPGIVAAVELDHVVDTAPQQVGRAALALVAHWAPTSTTAGMTGSSPCGWLASAQGYPRTRIGGRCPQCVIGSFADDVRQDRAQLPTAARRLGPTTRTSPAPRTAPRAKRVSAPYRVMRGGDPTTDRPQAEAEVPRAIASSFQPPRQQGENRSVGWSPRPRAWDLVGSVPGELVQPGQQSDERRSPERCHRRHLRRRRRGRRGPRRSAAQGRQPLLLPSQRDCRGSAAPPRSRGWRPGRWYDARRYPR